MSKLFGTIAVLAGISLSGFAHAVTEVNKTVQKVGVQGLAQGANYYVILTEPLTLNCLYNTLYIRPDYKDMYAQLLAAKIAGLPISRIDIEQPNGSGTQCTVSLVEIAN